MELTQYPKRPLFKWSGGKQKLLDRYSALNFFPDSSEFDTFVDLFFGAGAVTLWVAERYPDKNLVINDFNQEMMMMYCHMRDNWDEFLYHYQKTFEVFLNTPVDRRKDLYNCYKRRYAWGYKTMNPIEVSANLLVMMKINFNGIWLTYKKFGRRYSTAPGHVTYKPTVFDVSEVEKFRDVLRRATVYNRSFEDVPIPDNSWVYADPPYRETRDVQYAGTFDDDKQRVLVEVLKDVEERGGLYCLSNKCLGDGFWEDLFPEENIHRVPNKFTCGHGAAVNIVTEVLIKNYGHNILTFVQPSLEQFFSAA